MPEDIQIQVVKLAHRLDTIDRDLKAIENRIVVLAESIERHLDAVRGRVEEHSRELELARRLAQQQDPNNTGVYLTAAKPPARPATVATIGVGSGAAITLLARWLMQWLTS